MIKDNFETFAFVEKRSVPDGYGGFDIAYIEGVEFGAYVSTDNSTETRIAEKDGFTAFYTVFTDATNHLNYGDIIKRKKDEKYFKILSDYSDMIPPTRSNINISQVNAEKWTMPKN